MRHSFSSLSPKLRSAQRVVSQGGVAADAAIRQRTRNPLVTDSTRRTTRSGLPTSSCEKQNSRCGSELKGTRRDHEHDPSYGTLPLLRQADAAHCGKAEPRSAPSTHGRDPGDVARHLGAPRGLVAAFRKWHLHGVRQRSAAGSAERTTPSAKASCSVLRSCAWTRRRSLDAAVTLGQVLPPGELAPRAAAIFGGRELARSHDYSLRL